MSQSSITLTHPIVTIPHPSVTLPHIVTTCVIATPGMDYITRTITVDNEPVLLQLWDTAGQERFGPITAVYCRRADAFILVYDITNRSSFVGVKGWTDVIKV